MITRWGANIEKDKVLLEYPRPQMRRNSYINLNGMWQYAIVRGESLPDKIDGEILVPFSPECELSGVRRTVSPEDTLWYVKDFSLPADFNIGRVLLHFGAVDQIAEVFVNGVSAAKHSGGYWPFSADITSLLREGENILRVTVRDNADDPTFAYGKQRYKRGGMWYTAQSGIWQTVWAEWVPERYISALRITPDAAHSCVRVTVQSEYDGVCYLHFHGRRIGGFTNRETTIRVENAELWSPEHPKLYDFSAELGSDRVESYFALRDTAVGRDKAGRPCLLLNGKPYFHSGVLDQGYYPDGLYTAPSDEAMIYDITLMKRMGFNMLRKHIKVEPMRWYYHCDQLGMLVWQDMMNGGGDYRLLTISAPLFTHRSHSDHDYRRFARTDAAGRAAYYAELTEMVTQLYSCPCIVMWVPFNEGWGQFDAAEAVRRIEALDKTRTIDHASGWHDQRIGSIQSLHVYFYPYRYKPDRLGRAVILSEFGGYQLPVAGHTWNDANFGYKGYKTPEALMEAYRKLFETQILPARRKGLAASVYTQLSDVEDEVNGFVTYDRKVEKLDAGAVRAINQRLISEE